MNVKIYEMFLRDGLQSLKKVYTIPEKIRMFNSLNRCNYNCIEFGSTTNPKMLPQVGGSFELWNHIRQYNNDTIATVNTTINTTVNTTIKTKHTMLVPSINHLQNVIENDINSYGFVMSLSNEFSQRNMKMTSENSFIQIKELINKTIESYPNIQDLHIRVYISCSFGCPWEGFTKVHLARLDNIVSQISNIGYKNGLTSDQLDIVLSDTVGISDEHILDSTLNQINDKNYVALHMHIPGKIVNMGLEQNFESIIETALSKNIYKFDTSLFGIGGCPYAKKTDASESIGNLSTIPLVKYVHSKGFKTDVQLDHLETAAGEIKNIL